MATTTNDGDDGGSSGWEIFKLVAMVIGTIVILGWILSLVGALLSWAFPLLIVAGLLFLGYKLFLEDKSSGTVTTQDPPLLEHEAHSEADDILSDDPLEKKFEELEQRDSTAP